MLADCSIISLGGSKLTPINDVFLLKYDEDYGQAIDLSSSTVFDNVEKDTVLVKLRKTEDTALIDDNAGKSHDGGKILLLLFRSYAKFILFAIAVIS